MNRPKPSLASRFALGTTLSLIAGAAMTARAQDPDPCTQTTAPTGGTLRTTDGMGGSGDSHYELWHDGGGSMKMTTYNKNAAFKAEWNNAGDFLARVGLYWGNGAAYTTYGNVVADYNFTKSGSGGGYSYIGIYGWTKNPLVEYYIVENGFWSNPPNASALGGAQNKGTLNIDGDTYDIYTFTRRNAPNILGQNQDFPQFWSIRRKPRTCGRISISEHWKKWNEVGMKLGSMYEAKLLVEAGGGQGSFDMTYGRVWANKTSDVDRHETTPLVTKAGEASWANGKAGTLSLVSLDGKVVASARQEASQPAVISTSKLTKGVYVLRFEGQGAAPETRKFLLN